MFRFLANRLFCPIEARHIAHWAIAERDATAINALTAKAANAERSKDFFASLIPKDPNAFPRLVGPALENEGPGRENCQGKRPAA